MTKINKHIEIVRSTISELSSMSQESCDTIVAVLAKHYTKVGVTIISKVSDLETLVGSRPDLVFVGMECIPSDPSLGRDDPAKIWITKYLSEHGIAYTGSGYRAHELGRNKPLAKQRVLAAGLKTSPFFVIKQGQPIINESPSVLFPLFIKPANRGGGLGIDSKSVVNNFEQLQTKTRSIADSLHSDSLVERYLPGREFSVAILKGEHSTEYSVMPIELIAPVDARGARLLSEEIKSSNAEQAIMVADEIMKAKVSTLAIKVFHALGASDYGRIDIRLDKYGVPNFLEANLIPSLISGYGSFPKACVFYMGLGYEPMILKIAKLGFAKINTTSNTPRPTALIDAALVATETALEPV